MTAANRSSFLRFLDDYLDDQPSFNFNDAERHIASAPSTLADYRHVAFRYVRAREFEEPFYLSFDDTQAPSIDDEGRVWRNKEVNGAMNPVPRIDPGGHVIRRFPPLAITRSHIAAWFDAEPGKLWRTGIAVRPPNVCQTLTGCRRCHTG